LNLQLQNVFLMFSSLANWEGLRATVKP
jgi:hypothetical protein